MASNFDFLKKVDKELFSIVIDGEKLFRDEYFTQSVVQFRIYAEKMAKNIEKPISSEFTLDTILNNLKDKIKTEREKEFVDDLFFIKQQGNKCAHGEDISALEALEVIKRAFEAGVNYAYAKKKDENIDKLIFDETLLITQKPAKEEKLIDKYLKAAKDTKDEISKENFLNQKQGEFLSSVDKSKDENNIKDKNFIKNPIQYKNKKKKKELTPKQLKIKQKIKEARKNLKENINTKEKQTPQKKEPQKKTKKQTPQKQNPKRNTKKNKKENSSYSFIKALLFVIFVCFSIVLLLKMII